MRRSVLFLALLCAMCSVMAKAAVPRHSTAHSRTHNAKLRTPHAAGRARHSDVSLKRAKASASRSARPVHAAVGRSRTSRRPQNRSIAARREALRPQRKTISITLPIRPLRPAPLALLPPLKGSRESLVRQNVRADQDGLSRIENDDALAGMLQTHQLVSLPVSNGLVVDTRLPANRRYCRGWTATFLADMARAHYDRFHAALQINSAVRTVEYQRHLQGINGNAAPAVGEIASPHLTGATIDIGKKGLSMSEIGWMRAYLLPLQSTGKIDVEEEFQQSCFHISVYKSYSMAPSPGFLTGPLTAHRGGSTTMVAARLH